MSASSELLAGVSAMTPEIPNAQMNLPPEPMGTLSRKQSKASIARSEDVSMPSPPMSPYQSTTQTKDASNSIEFKQSQDHTELITQTPKDQIITSEVTPAPTDIIVVLKRSGEEFPLSTFQETPLIVNAWNGTGTKAFKNSQLVFLRSYINRSKSYKPINKNYTRKYAPRRVVKSYYNDVNNFSPSNNHYNSDSDYNSQFEKVRTRRVVRESSSHPTFPDPETPPAKTHHHSTTNSSVVKKRKPATFSSPSAPTNLDWEAVPDYSPDVSTLPSNPRCLKVEWKGQPMNLSDDPLLDKLHPAEITLASILRLPCNLYLDSKRRIFAEKVSRLKKNLPFRRTDAQKSCRIDVNKASRLFAAFEKIGWLEDEKFEKFL